MIDYEMISNRIRQTRTGKGMSQRELADKLGVSKEYISRMECGHAKLNNIEVIDRISEILDVPFEYLVKGIVVASDEYMRDEIAEILKGCSPERKKTIIKIANLVTKI